MKQASLSLVLEALRDNLTAQHQAMLADDLPRLSELTKEQQEIYNRLDSFSPFSGIKTSRESQLLAEINELLTTNALLARQSLAFAKRMLEALDTGDGGGKGFPLGTGLNRQG